MPETTNTLIVGGGQAGLSLSYFLTQQGREHLVLDRALQPGDAWRSRRWDSFALNTPNWSIRLPGAEYDGPDPDGFLLRGEIVRTFEAYVWRLGAPIRYGVTVTAVDAGPGGFLVRAGDTVYRAANVVIATGLFQSPRVPPFAADLPDHVAQETTDSYRNPQALPPGAVLVVGSGQSGCQIAEDLHDAGRKVYLSTGSAGRLPRRYRGRDVMAWLTEAGFMDRTPDKLASPREKFAPNPHISGTRGGHTINLHQFARDGITLLGHAVGVQGGRLIFAPDLKDNLARADKAAAEALKAVDQIIAARGLEVPDEDVPELRDGYAAKEILSLDLAARGITSVIWSCGYTFDFSLVRFPVFDADGYPITRRGVTDVPGLYFLGLPWLHTFSSGLLYGVGGDAAHVAGHIAARD